jgi:hypothetical protein
MNDDQHAAVELPMDQEVSPEALEQKMLENAAEADPTGTAADKAAAFFKKSAAELANLVPNMSKRALERMIMHVATYPLLGKEYIVKIGSIEHKAAYRFNEMVMQKTIMQLQFEADKAQKAIDEGKDKEQLSLTKQGDTEDVSNKT